MVKSNLNVAKKTKDEIILQFNDLFEGFNFGFTAVCDWSNW